jgi:superfamily II DNA or RNA helicase
VSFKDCQFPISIKGTDGDPKELFFGPALRRSSHFDLKVGYFTADWFRHLATEVAAFVENEGAMRWIVSVKLFEAEYDMFFKLAEDRNGSSKLQEKLETKVIEDIDRLEEELEADTLVGVMRMIQDGCLEFKIAFTPNHGFLHAKMGYMRSVSGEELAFNGSYNHSGAKNWEVIDIYGCDNDEARIKDKKDEFQKAWDNEDSGLRVFKPTKPVLERCEKIVQNYDRLKATETVEPHRPSIPEMYLDKETLELRDHQEKAIAQWEKQDRRGIFNMATGSGKTVTALAAATRLYEQRLRDTSKPLVLLISAPSDVLLKQWGAEVRSFNYDESYIVECSSQHSNWTDKLSDKVRQFRREEDLSKVLVIIVTVQTLGLPKFKQRVTGLDLEKVLFVCDEMHEYGTGPRLISLPEANFRIGLSATPLRKGDDQGTEGLQAYFGDEVICYTLEDGINDDVLCQYNYYPEIIELTHDEAREYRDLSVQIARAYGATRGDSPSTGYYEALTYRRARLVGTAENKLPRLLALLKRRLSDDEGVSDTLIYVSDAKNEAEHEEDIQLDIGDRTIDEVVLKVSELDIKIRPYTSEEHPDERKKILQAFNQDRLDALAAIKCLDQGVDIPKLVYGYVLASSRNERQFVQRRGRLLRKYKGKSLAHIYDFVVVPPVSEGGDSAGEDKLFKKELDRVDEFASCANNILDIMQRLRSVKERFGYR